MANLVVVMGDSGSGKSTSTRNLDPSTTFYLNLIDKPLPFRGWKSKYQFATKENPNGNMYRGHEWENIIRVLNRIDVARPEIKTIIIDDFQYVMSFEYLERAKEVGFNKFTEIGLHAFSVIRACAALRSDVTVVFLTHTETDDHGKIKIKTIGNMLDRAIDLAGLFTYVFQSVCINSNYVFLTQYDGQSIAKTPMGVFEDKYIPNDLAPILQAIVDFETLPEIAA